MILTPILLLNMLIASMGNTYQRVIAISEKERIRQVRIDGASRLQRDFDITFPYLSVGSTGLDHRKILSR